MSNYYTHLILSLATALMTTGVHAQPPTADTATEPLASTPQPDAAPVKKTPAASLAAEALRQAALQGNAEQVIAALTAGTPVDAAGEDQRTPLMLASFNGHVEIMNRLMEAGADVRRADAFGRTALHYASTGTSVDAVRVLLAGGADVNRTDGGEKWTPLMYAAAEGHIDIVEALLKADADPASKDVDGETALDFARNAGHLAAVKRIEAAAR